jgi:flagellar export protein FliJ
MNRAFRFRLGRVLRVRGIAERTARAEWASAEVDARRAEDAADALRANIDLARRELAELQSTGPLLAGEILASNRAVDRMRESLTVGRARSAGLRKAAEALRATWSERRREEQALERLAERQHEAHRTAVRRAENAENDDWASARGRSRRDRPESHSA